MQNDEGVVIVDGEKKVYHKIDPQDCNVPNINFSVKLFSNDGRLEKFKDQRLKRGFDSSELWNLDITIAKFIYPRLKSFSKNLIGHPGNLESVEQWKKILDKMIRAFKLLSDDSCPIPTPKQTKQIHKGLKLFVKYYYSLWN